MVRSSGYGCPSGWGVGAPRAWVREMSSTSDPVRTSVRERTLGFVQARAMPLMLILQGMFTLGFAYLVAALSVYIRDLKQTLPMLMTFWFFLSPIFYVVKQLKSDMSWILEYNPMTFLLESYRQIFVLYPGMFPETKVGDVPWRYVGSMAIVAVVVLFIGYRAFMRAKPRFPDEV